MFIVFKMAKKKRGMDAPANGELSGYTTSQ
jgi:hypothetical protein